MPSSVVSPSRAKSLDGSGHHRRVSRLVERIAHLACTLCGAATVGFVVLVTAFLVASGVPAIREVGVVDFLFGTVWKPTGTDAQYGILPFVLTSVYGTLGATLLAVPLGVACATYLAKAPKGVLPTLVRGAVELTLGVPSVVYGLVGMLVVVPAVREAFDLPDGANLLSATLVLATMVLPSVVSVSESAIRAVPKEYEEASLALGATQSETLCRVTLPSARSGLLTAVVLGMGRALGESMAVMMVSGNVANMPSPFQSVRFLTTAVASEMSYASGLHRQALFSVALVLFVSTMLVDLGLYLATKRWRRG